MTPNGAVLFAAVAILGAMVSGGRGLAAGYAVAALFALTQIAPRTGACLRRAAIVMAPLAAFMLIIWVGVVGKSPQEIASNAEGTRSAALFYVATVAARLFLIVFVLQAVLLRFDHDTPFAFVRALRVPAGAKRMMILTLSLIETLRNAVDRAYTALVAAGIVTRGLSLKNLRTGWILVQTVWLTAITTVTARMRDKWPVEDTLALLDPALDGGERRLSPPDWLWLGLAVAALALGQYLVWAHG